jgi:hypothetical protein
MEEEKEKLGLSSEGGGHHGKAIMPSKVKSSGIMNSKHSSLKFKIYNKPCC